MTAARIGPREASTLTGALMMLTAKFGEDMDRYAKHGDPVDLRTALQTARRLAAAASKTTAHLTLLSLAETLYGPPADDDGEDESGADNGE